MKDALTYDDVLLVPQYSEILPAEVNTESQLSRNIPLKIPIISSPMDTVTEHRMAIAMALQGGIGIIHKNLSPEEQAAEVQQVKRFENGFIKDPITVSINAKIDDVYKIAKEKGYKNIPVIGKQNKLAGIVTELDYFWPHDKGEPVRKIMTAVKDMTVAEQNTALPRANEIIRTKKLAVLCLTNKKGELTAMVTRSDLKKNMDFPFANKDKNKHLYVGAAIGVVDIIERAELLAGAGVDAIVVDTAHGHSKGVIDTVKILKKTKKMKNVDIIAGNVATAKAVKKLIEVGVDGIKIGIGPGSICTTRIVAGVGVPQLTAIKDASTGRGKNTNVPLIADGGINYSGDIVKALAFGADSVMLGSLLAGAEESPGESIFMNGRMYKTYRGMGSLSAMQQGSKDRYGQAEVNDKNKFVPEGIEGKILYRGPIDKMIYQLVGGLRSGMGYLGAKTIKELPKKAEYVKITNAGKTESHPHNLSTFDDAPNYKK